MSELRLIVGRPGGLHGVSWRVWTDGDEIRIKPRSMQGSCKVRVHPPNHSRPDRSDRAFFFGAEMSWLKQRPGAMQPVAAPPIQQYWPRALGPGVVRIAGIRVHPEAVTSNKPVTKGSSHIWLDPPVRNQTTVVHILLVDHTPTARQWCLDRQAGMLCGLVDESSLGDVILYVSHQNAGPVPIELRGEGDPDDFAPGDLEGIAFGIDGRDGSILIDEMPMRLKPPS